MSSVFDITWEHYNEAALKLFEPKRFLEMLTRVFNILIEEVGMAVIISKVVLVPIDTGYMQSRIGIIEINSGQFYIIAGTDGVPYAMYVEFGTSKMAARPFWTPPIWEAWFRFMSRSQLEVDKWARGN